ncbi:MAG: UxaA family hydrolase [Hyphomicrobiales bacterium]
MRRDAIVIKKQDNVATAIRDIAAGKTAMVGVEDEGMIIRVGQDIPFGHKLALRHIHTGEDILKYGTVIGRATSDIQPGDHVHVHNVESTRARGDWDGAIQS